MQRRMQEQTPGIVIIVVMAAVGLVAGVSGVYAWLGVEQIGRWQEIETPPGKVVDLLAATSSYVVVEMEDGGVYRVACAEGDEGTGCWRETERPAEGEELPCDRYTLRPPPENTEERLATCFEQEVSILVQYALLNDGRLMRWEVVIAPLGRLVRVLRAAVFGLLVGGGMGIVLVSVRESRKVTVEREQPTNDEEM